MNYLRKAGLGVALGFGGFCLAATAGASSTVSPMELVQPVADYKAYVAGEVTLLVAETEKFAAAVKAGDLKAAQALYPPTRVHYERVEPIAELFSDLDGSVDSRADDHDQKEKDPGFTGFHRLEYGLFSEQSTAGLEPVADKLVSDVKDLQGRIAGLTVPPDKMVGGAAALIEEVAATKITGEEDRYSHTDLSDFNGNVEGAKQAYELLKPVAAANDADLAKTLDQEFAALEKLLGSYRQGDAFVSYDTVGPEQRKALSDAVNALAEPLSKLAATVAR